MTAISCVIQDGVIKLRAYYYINKTTNFIRHHHDKDFCEKDTGQIRTGVRWAMTLGHIISNFAFPWIRKTGTRPSFIYCTFVVISNQIWHFLNLQQPRDGQSTILCSHQAISRVEKQLLFVAHLYLTFFGGNNSKYDRL